MRKAKSVDNQYGLLTVISRVYKSGQTKNAFWECLCACGNKVIATGAQLRKGRSHCGERKHMVFTKALGMVGTPTYVSWTAAKTRCSNPNQAQWHDYGGRGIQMCDRWKNSFAAFFEDMGERPPGMSLDRIDGNKNYEPGNCRWINQTGQNRNSRRVATTEQSRAKIRKLAGTKPQREIAKLTNVSVSTVNRIIRGISWN